MRASDKSSAPHAFRRAGGRIRIPPGPEHTLVRPAVRRSGRARVGGRAQHARGHVGDLHAPPPRRVRSPILPPMSEPVPSETLPLAGLLVADLTRVLAGPYCTRLLADMGARVIKVERPGEGDETRRGPHQLEPGRDEIGR